MRTVTYGAACSLDGFITARDGAIDWIHFGQGATEYMQRFWPTIDTIVMGRKTFDFANAMGGGGKRKPKKAAATKGATARRKAPANPWAGMKSIVFSRTLDPADYPDVEVVSADAGEYVRELKRQPGKGICVMGGGELACSLFEAGVIDEVGANVHPVLLGAGVPLFRDPGRRIALELAESWVMDGGCVMMMYRVKQEAGNRE